MSERRKTGTSVVALPGQSGASSWKVDWKDDSRLVWPRLFKRWCGAWWGCSWLERGKIFSSLFLFSKNKSANSKNKWAVYRFVSSEAGTAATGIKTRLVKSTWSWAKQWSVAQCGQCVAQMQFVWWWCDHLLLKKRCQRCLASTCNICPQKHVIYLIKQPTSVGIEDFCCACDEVFAKHRATVRWKIQEIHS